MDAIHEPAILYLIFRELTQLDLLRLQRVCSAWRNTIIDNTELLSMMWLHPGCMIDTNETLENQAIINPLLAQAFPSFLQCRFNEYTAGRGNHGPWYDLAGQLAWASHPLDLAEDRKHRDKFMRPEASWRKMLLIWPPPNELQIHLDYGYDAASKVARLKFSNRNESTSSKPHPPWLTFGFIHDIIENAWFRGLPHYPISVQIEYAGIIESNTSASGYPLVPSAALVSEDFRLGTLPQPGRVSVNLKMSLASEVQRKEQHDAMFAARYRGWEQRRDSRKPRIELCGTGRLMNRMPIPPHIFTDEFHFEDGVSFQDVDWDEMHEYRMPARPEWPDDPDPRPKRSRWREMEDYLACGLLLVPPLIVYAILVWPVLKVVKLCKKLLNSWRRE